MAEFKAVAGPSPNCEAVLVQIEHWANKFVFNIAAIKNTIRNTHFLFIKTRLHGKDITENRL